MDMAIDTLEVEMHTIYDYFSHVIDVCVFN